MSYWAMITYNEVPASGHQKYIIIILYFYLF